MQGPNPGIPTTLHPHPCAPAATRLPGEQQLYNALQGAQAAASKRRAGGKPELWAVAAELRAAYPIKVRHALGGKARGNYLRTLRHSFLILPGGVEGNEGAFFFWAQGWGGGVGRASDSCGCLWFGLASCDAAVGARQQPALRTGPSVAC